MQDNNIDIPCLEFNGKYYGIGTKVLLQDAIHGTGKAEIIGFNCLRRPIYVGIEPGFECEISDVFSNHRPRILEIIDPVEVFPKTNSTQYYVHGYPSQGDVQLGWIWYIVVMIFASMLEDKILAWCGATFFFWTWLKTKK